MAITFPLTPPATPKVREFRLDRHAVVGLSESPWTGLQQVQAWPGGHWRAHVKLPPMKGRAEFQPWSAFLTALNGLEGTFLMADPERRTPLGVAGGTPVVDGIMGAQVRSLPTRGWPNSTTSVLKAGDLIQLGSGATARLYEVLQDANSNGTGRVTLEIWPGLRASSADGASIVLTTPVGRWRLAQNLNGIDVNWRLLHGLEFDIREAV